MSILSIALILLILYVGYKIGTKAIKWVLFLVALAFCYWFFTSGGGIKTPANMPKIPDSFTAPLTAPIHS